MMHIVLLGFVGLVLAWGLMGPNPRRFIGWTIVAIVFVSVSFIAFALSPLPGAIWSPEPAPSRALTFDDLPIAPTCSATVTHSCWREACQKEARCSMELWQQ
jgi:hypothetical protein